MRRIFTILVLLLSCAAPLLAQEPAQAAPQTKGCEDFAPDLDAAAKRLASLKAGANGRQAFSTFTKGLTGKPSDPRWASCVLRRYTLARYGERMVKDLQEMVGFQTFAVEGKENWNAPEFARQREWLRKRAAELGLQFKTYDGRVDELTLRGPKPVLALLTHGDVQGVEGQKWSSPPFEAKIVNGRIVGRGTEDDKGPLVAALYSLATLRDSGWPLGSTVKLLIANGEESSWEEIPYYLARAPMPERTVGLDAAYPVTHAQKGYGILTFRAQPVAEPKPGQWRVVRMSGGSGMSIIPERGEAVLEKLGTALERSRGQFEIARLLTEWAEAHPPARLWVRRDGEYFKLTAEGHGGHSSEPHSGHNALGDLTAFLATLDLTMDPWGALASFTGIAVGTETNGAALGLAHRDAVMGELTSNLSFLREDKGAPVAEINIRYPRGITRETMEKQLADRTAAFTRKTGATIETTVNLTSEPHLAPAEGPLVSTLLDVWKEVTGTPGRPLAIGGGTQARFFKGGVDFGPATDMEHYRGHGTDEYLTPEELRRIAELTVTAVWRLAGK
jgi:dipeptidase D